MFSATRRLFLIAGLTSVYFVAGKLGLSIALVHPSASPVWPPAGIALAALLLFGPGVWPSITVGAFLVNVTTFGSWETSLAIAVGNTLEAVAGALLVERTANGARCFFRGRDVLRFIVFGGLASTMISPTLGITSLALARLATWSDYPAIWLTWWLGDVSGDLVVAPFVILWATAPRIEWSRGRWIEASVLLGAIAVLGFFVIFPSPPLPEAGYPAAFLAFPLILWAAFGFGPRETATVVLLISVVAVSTTLLGVGPFAFVPENQSLLLLDSFLVVATLTGLGLAAVVHEQQSTAEALKRAQRQLRDLLLQEHGERLQAEATSRAKDHFLAILGHELRSPLAALTHASAALRNLPRTQSDRGELEGILERQTRYLSRLVDDLLDVSRLDSGKVRLMPEVVDMKEIVERCMGSFQQSGAFRSRIVSADLESAWVNADPTRLIQVVTNLLENAVKFTPEAGRIRVSLRAVDSDALLTIQDDGRGIDAKTLPQIFDFFAQGEDSLDRSHGGLGIGLTVVRRLVELHAGRVEARSDGLGRGSEFVVRLPLHAAAPYTRAASAAAAEKAPRKSLRVLVIEDYADSRLALEVCLRMLGHTVDTADDGQRGIDLALQSRPDVALVDIGLPGVDGYEVAKRLRGSPVGGRMVLFAITGYGDPAMKRRALDAGFDDCLVKPVDPDQLNWLLTTRAAITETARRVGPVPGTG
jgi:signal transduction histidine kinase/CheY-like chemotaxis protein